MRICDAFPVQAIGHICILGNGLELAWNGGSCGGISLKREKCDLHLKRLPALASVKSYFHSNTVNAKIGVLLFWYSFILYQSFSNMHFFFCCRFSLCSEPSCLLMEASVPPKSFTRDC